MKQQDKPHQPDFQPNQNPPKKRTKARRRDNCLIGLTRRLTRLLRESDGYEVDLNVASSALSIPKRRLYDIANVLEGIGYITRSQKNHIRWERIVDLPQIVARMDPLPVDRRPIDLSEGSQRREQAQEGAKESGEFDCLQLGVGSGSDENGFDISRSV